MSGSTFVIVLWIAVGLVSLTLYFGQSMSFELRAADNRTSGLAADQAIEGAARYVAAVLASRELNGTLPDPETYANEAVRVGEAHFWLIGRDTNEIGGAGQVCFGLVDEASKLNLNSARTNELAWLPWMTPELTAAIVDWRDTNGGSGAFQAWYAMQSPSYMDKCAPFETIDELRLLYGADMAVLLGEDLNRNGLLDPNEYDDDRNGVADPGVLEYVTVYSREPNTYSNGTPRVNIRAVPPGGGPLATLLQSTFGSARANQILGNLGLMQGGGRGGPPPAAQVSFRSPLEFYRQGRMTTDEFAQIAHCLTVVSGSYIEGRVNVNTASEVVLACLPGLCDAPDLARTLVDYRQSNPDKLGSVAWLVDALGTANASILGQLQTRDLLTTESFQFTADVAALGPHGRGYRRTRFVFDTCDGTPRIVYRQELTHVGWALGRDVREAWLAAKESR